MLTESSLCTDSTCISTPLSPPVPSQQLLQSNHSKSRTMLNRCQSNGTNSNLVSCLDFSRSTKPLFNLPDGKVITYGEFEKRVINYAAYLRNQFNIEKGDRIAAQVTKCVDSIALYLSTLRIGAIYVPLNTDYKLEEIRYFLTDSAPSLFVCRQVDKAKYENLVAEIENSQLNGHSKFKCVVMDENELSIKTNIVDEELANNNYGSIEKMDINDLAAICYTSGTTGKPKGAMITHGNLLSNAKALCETWRVIEKDVLLHALPIYHVHGLFVALNTILFKGASLNLLPRFDVESALEMLTKSTVMMGVPTYYTRLLQCCKLDRNLVKSIRLFISGSAPLLENTWNGFKERTGHEILERYGMTEGQMVCSNPYDGKRKPGTVGRPLPLVTARIRNSVLEYKGPNLFGGYWCKPEKTKEDFTEDGFFISGDLADIDEEGYVRILGRGKDLIITGGLNVYPKEVENVIDIFPDVMESAVIGVPHPDFGEAVVAVVVTKNSDQPSIDRIESTIKTEIIQQLKSQIANFKVPKRVFIQNQLPRNSMGKVQKNVLRERYQHIFES